MLACPGTGRTYTPARAERPIPLQQSPAESVPC
jgi:hypothetical protein